MSFVSHINCENIFFLLKTMSNNREETFFREKKNKKDLKYKQFLLSRLIKTSPLESVYCEATKTKREREREISELIKRKKITR